MDNHNGEEALHKEEESKFTKCEAEREEYLNGWKRAKADLINYQKDEARRFEEIMKFALSETLKDLVPVLDSFDLALRVLEKEGFKEHDPGKSPLKGIQMIRQQLYEALAKRGLEAIKISPGDEFNPRYHESIGEAVATFAPGTIAEEIEIGYMLHGRVLRPSRVRLSKAPTDN